MKRGTGKPATLRFAPATPERWPDLAALFGARGACGGCWCMYWRQTRAEYEKRKGAGNRRALRKLVTAGPPPGLLAYADGQPVGWCAIAPREIYPTLARSRVLAPLDAAPVWSATCFFVARPYRRQGLTARRSSKAIRWKRGKVRCRTCLHSPACRERLRKRDSWRRGGVPPPAPSCDSICGRSSPKAALWRERRRVE